MGVEAMLDMNIQFLIPDSQLRLKTPLWLAAANDVSLIGKAEPVGNRFEAGGLKAVDDVANGKIVESSSASLAFKPAAVTPHAQDILKQLDRLA